MSEEGLKRAFGAVWWRFLEFEISRSKMMSEVAGNQVCALILQVVAYHNLTIIQFGVKNDNYENIRERWKTSDENTDSDMPRKLSYAAVSDITGIDKETVRRSVNKLAEQEWIVIEQKYGIHYQPSAANQEKLITLNEWELEHLGRLLAILERNKEMN